MTSVVGDALEIRDVSVTFSFVFRLIPSVLKPSVTEANMITG